MTKFTVPQVPGQSRKSDRNYTHAIIGQFDAARNRVQAVGTVEKAQDAKNFKYYQHVVAVGVGGIWTRDYKVDQQQYDHAAAILAAAPTVEEYVAQQCARRIAAIDKANGPGELGPLVVLQWSQSAANANKGMASHSYYRNVRVVETVASAK